MVFKIDNRLMQVKSIAECSKGSIFQYIRPLLSYQLSLRHVSCLFLSGRFTHFDTYSQFLRCFAIVEFVFICIADFYTFILYNILRGLCQRPLRSI